MNLWMPVFAISLVVLALVTANLLGWPRVAPGGTVQAGLVSVLIPARNEERLIVRVLDSALTRSNALLEVLVYDDHSTDRTAALVQEKSAGNPRIRRVPPQPLPDGWCGKPFACSRLAAEAHGEWLLFIDADVVLRPGAVDAITAEAIRRRVTFLSCWPELERRGFWENVLMPMLNFVVFTLFPAPLSRILNRPSLGLAHGACILIRAADYHRTGGHAMVRGELFEDTALARAWRGAGMKGLCLDGQDWVRVRMYHSLTAIWKGFQKNTYPAFQHEWNFWMFLTFHILIFIVPFMALGVYAATGPIPWPVGGTVAAIGLSRALQAVRFRYSFGSILLHPIAECALIAVALTSWFKCRTGKGIEWKGRHYRGRVS